MGTKGRTGNRSAVRVAAASTVVLLLILGTALVAGANAYSGVSCSAGTSSITVSWNGEMRAYQYTAWVRNSAGSEISQIVDWSGRTTGSASSEFSDLSAGTYTVGVTMQTVDGSWISIGEATCTVTATTPTTTTAAPTTTTTTPAADSPGSLSCTATASSITVTASLNEPAASTATAWETFVEHSLGYPRLGHLTSLQEQSIDTDGDGEADITIPAGGLSTTFNDLAQGTWNVTGNVSVPGTSPNPSLSGTSCTVAGGL